MPSAFNYDPTIISDNGCKLFNYFAYGLGALSPWCLVYISFERFIVIKYYAKRFVYKKRKKQIIFLILLVVFNILYHINIFFSFDIVNIDNSTICYINDNQNQIIVANMVLVNYFLLPFFLMLLFTFLVYIFYISYGVNFYILLVTNSLFRKQFYSLFYKKKVEIQNNLDFPLNQIQQTTRPEEAAKN